MPLLPCEVIIPLVSGQTRAPWPTHKLPAWEDACAMLFGGISPIAIGVTGIWMNWQAPAGQRRVPDPQNRYELAVDMSRVEELRAFMRFTCAHFEQECLYFKTPQGVELLDNPAGWPPP